MFLIRRRERRADNEDRERPCLPCQNDIKLPRTVSAQREKARVVPVSMMVEHAERQLLDEARSYAEQRSKALQAVVAPLEQEVPYIPYYRYQNRRLPVGWDRELQRSLLHVAEIISSATDLQWIDPWEMTAVTQRLGSESKDEEQAVLWDATPYEGGGPYIFISYSRNEKDLRLFFIRDLVQLGFPIWWEKRSQAGLSGRLTLNAK